MLSVSTAIERWPTEGSFVISRGAKHSVEVVTCTVSDGDHIGQAEATPIYYQGEDSQSCKTQIDAFAVRHSQFDRGTVQQHMSQGAARNVLDCALWDLECQQKDQPLWRIAGLPEPKPLTTAFTISLNDPDRMELDARKAAANGYQLLKLKLSGKGDDDRVAAVHRGAPNARLIIDANESWNDLDIEREASLLQKMGVELIEQPVSAGQDHLLRDVRSPIPLCADESCHTSADVERLAPFYDAVNIKLDKAGGLSEAIAIAKAAEALGLKMMVGCMLSTSLGIRPAFSLAQWADWVDLDGPMLLAKDREEQFRFEDGQILPPG